MSVGDSTDTCFLAADACDLRMAAEEYLANGLSVLPAMLAEKRPEVKGPWEPFKKRLPTTEEVSRWFANGRDALCLVCGGVSGNLEAIDFDCAGELFEPWRKEVEATAPGLFDRLVIESTPSGGWHVLYRCEAPISGNLKLAQRKHIVADNEIRINDAGRELVTLYGKEYAVRTDDSGIKHVLLTLIETRGEGGIILCAPTTGYKLSQGDITALPVLTTDERDTLIETAQSLNEHWMEPVGQHQQAPNTFDQLRPGDDFNERGDVRELLINHGWTRVKDGENEYWRRPGKDKGWSATLKAGVFYVFSSNAAPFEPNVAYSPFSVYAQLECGGDFSQAAHALRQQGYGGALAPGNLADVDISGIIEHLSEKEKVPVSYISARELCENHKELRKPVIHGLLREGETMNVIAAPKTGKSWLVLNLGLSIVTGMDWLGFDAEPGNVLLIDNELHPETLANRIPRVADAMELPRSLWRDGLYIQSMRGCLEDLLRMEAYFNTLPKGFFKLIILDAFYRFIPMDKSENDNSIMAGLYNVIDRCAAKLGAGFVLIHHTSKGLQSGKSVTDVGAGAGSQSRAADCHLILRRHEENNCLAVDAVARSFPPPRSFVLRQEFPLWVRDDSLSPLDMEKPYQKKRSDAAGLITTPVAPKWTPEAFVERFVDDNHKTKIRIIAEANAEGLSDHKAGKLLEKAEALELVYRWAMGNHRLGYATQEQPEQEADAPLSKRQAIKTALCKSPALSVREIAEDMDVTERYVRHIKNSLKEAEQGRNTRGEQL